MSVLFFLNIAGEEYLQQLRTNQAAQSSAEKYNPTTRDGFFTNPKASGFTDFGIRCAVSRTGIRTHAEDHTAFFE